MDKKGTWIATSLTVLVVLGYLYLQSYIARKWPVTPIATRAPEVTQPADTQPASWPAATGPADTQPTTGAVVSTTGPALPNIPSIQPAGGWALVPATNPSAVETALLGSGETNDPQFPMGVHLTPMGAGIANVQLNHFKNSADFDKPEKQRRIYEFQQPYASYGDSSPLATKWVTINGRQIPMWGASWVREELNPSAERPNVNTAARYSTTLSDGAGGVVKLTKTFGIMPSTDKNTLGYELAVDYKIENLSPGPVKVKSVLNGPTLPPRESPRPPDRQIIAGFHEGLGITVEHHAVETFTGHQRIIDLTKNKKGGGPLPVSWVGASSVYFNAFVYPEHPLNNPTASPVVHVAVEAMELEDKLLKAEDRPIVMSLETAEPTLQPGESLSVPLKVYMGPRWREVLNAQHYADVPRDYDGALIVKSGPCWFCTIDILINGLVAMLSAFHWVAHDWGLAIIALVAIVRLVLHPITKRSQVQMLKMGKLGPEAEKLKKKYGDNKDELNRQMLLLYKENGFGPLLGCLPMFLQMPIWIALYSALQTTFELRHSPFLWGFTWIHDLSKPDYLFKFDHPIPLILFGWTLEAINLLPILMGIVFFVNQKYTPKPPATTPEQVQQQKMMQWMTLLFPVFLYNGPSGLNLYIMTSTLIGIAESKIIRKHIKEREELEKLNGPVIVDAKPRSSRRGREEPEPPPKKTGLMGWLQRMQEKAEEVRKQQEKGQRKT